VAVISQNMTNHAQQAASLLAISLGMGYHALSWRRFESSRPDQSKQIVKASKYAGFFVFQSLVITVDWSFICSTLSASDHRFDDRFREGNAKIDRRLRTKIGTSRASG